MTRLQAPSRIVLLSGLLASVACGPPKAGGAGDDEGTSTEAETSTTSPSTTSGSSSETGSEAETDDGLPTTAFVPEEDFICDCSPCHPLIQDCPEGEKCVPYPSSGEPVPDATKCVFISGEQSPGEPCTMPDPIAANDDCDEASICWDRLDGEHGTCRAFCTGSVDYPICGPGEVCFLAYQGSVNVCVSGCDPLLQDCGAGFGCYYTGQVFACSVTSAGIEVGEPCGFIDDCNPGLLCTDADAVPGCSSASCCTPYCDPSLGDADCAELPGTTCELFYEEGLGWDLDTFGVCLSLQP
jgi:hypothetical protein